MACKPAGEPDLQFGMGSLTPSRFKKHLHAVLVAQKALALACLMLFPSSIALTHYFDFHERAVSARRESVHVGLQNPASL